jgi:hypothetical protein
MINSNPSRNLLFILCVAYAAIVIISCQKDSPSTGQRGGSIPREIPEKENEWYNEEGSKANSVVITTKDTSILHVKTTR